MLRASLAIRMGLRAAARNPELAFGKALLDLAGNVMSTLPVLLAGMLLWRAAAHEELLGGVLQLLRAAQRMGWSIAGALFAAAVISWALAAAFWAGALPTLAADAEMNARPPADSFFPLAFAGFARVAGASAVGAGLSLLVSLCLFAAILLGLPLFFLHPSLGLTAALAALFTCSFLTGLFVDLLGNLALVRSAALGDGPATAFIRGAQLLGARIGSVLAIGAIFFLAELVLATAFGVLVEPILSAAPMTFDGQLLALAPRFAISIATTLAFAWVEVARQGALAALAADAEGLIEVPPEPPPRAMPGAPPRRTEAWALRPPPIAVQPKTPERPREPAAEIVVEALPVSEEPILEALPVAEEPPADPTGAPHDRR